MSNEDNKAAIEGQFIKNIIAAQIGTPDQVDIIQSHMDEYFKRFPSYKEKFSDLEWYHIFLDFFDKIHVSPSPVQGISKEGDVQKTLWSTIWSMAHSMKSFDFIEHFRKQYLLSSPSSSKEKEKVFTLKQARDILEHGHILGMEIRNDLIEYNKREQQYFKEKFNLDI